MAQSLLPGLGNVEACGREVTASGGCADVGQMFGRRLAIIVVLTLVASAGVGTASSLPTSPPSSGSRPPQTRADGASMPAAGERPDGSGLLVHV